MQSEDILRANLEALSKRNPKLASQLSSNDIASLIPQNIPAARLEMGRKGLPTLQAEDANGSFYLHSMYDPVREAEQFIANEFSLDDINVVVILGFGLGYTLEALLSQVDDKMSIVVVEPDIATLHAAASVHSLEHFFKRDNINWVVGHNPDQSVGQVMLSLQLDKLEGWNALIAPAMMRRYIEFSKPFVSKLGSAIAAQKVGLATDSTASELFMRNSFENLKFAATAPGVVHLTNKWKDRPVMIVSSGPSLEKQLPLLREIQDRFLIIAAGSAWQVLRPANIEPDIVVSVDPFPTNYRHFIDIKSKGAWLVADCACNADVVRTFANRRIFAHSTTKLESAFESFYGTRGVLESGGSVANSAFSLAKTMGASPIILIGQDLAYTGGKSHSPGIFGKTSIGDLKRSQPAKPFRDIPGYYGDIVVTDDQFDTFRYWFELTIARNPDLHVINATEGGAKIEGTQQMPLAEVVQIYGSPIPVEIDSLWPEQSLFIDSKADVRQNTREIRDQLISIQRLAKKAMKTAQRLLERHEDPQAQRKLTKELNAAEKQLLKRSNTGKLILGAFLQKETFAARRNTHLTESGSTDHYKISADMHRHIHRGCERAVEALDGLLESI